MRGFILIVSSIFVSIVAPPLQAEQYGNGGQVVHTRRAPVVAHKVVPPFRGVHVYEGRGSRR